MRHLHTTHDAISPFLLLLLHFLLQPTNVQSEPTMPFKYLFTASQFCYPAYEESI